MSDSQTLDLDKAIIVIALLALAGGVMLFLLLLWISRLFGLC